MTEVTVKMNGIGGVNDVETLFESQMKDYDGEIIKQVSENEVVVDVIGETRFFRMDIEAIGGEVLGELDENDN